MGLPLYQVDAFTAEPFGGNPAAVCLLPAPADEAWMQRVAAEMNLSETAFLHREDAPGAAAAWRLRWFTPVTEVDLCGHATLASAHVLLARGEPAPLRFATRSGELRAARRGGLVELDFPALPVEEAPAPDGLLAALGAGGARACGRSRFDLLVELASEAEVRALAPDFAALARVAARGVVVTAAGRDHDFVSRFFCPGVGIDEDPVTGSAHCALAPYWSARLGRAELTGYQASARGGIVHVRAAGERVHLGGHAVTVVSGELLA